MTTLQVQLKTPPYDPKKNFLEYHTTIFLTQSNLQESMMSNFDILAQYFHRIALQQRRPVWDLESQDLTLPQAQHIVAYETIIKIIALDSSPRIGDYISPTYDSGNMPSDHDELILKLRSHREFILKCHQDPSYVNTLTKTEDGTAPTLDEALTRIHNFFKNFHTMRLPELYAVRAFRMLSDKDSETSKSRARSLIQLAYGPALGSHFTQYGSAPQCPIQSLALVHEKFSGISKNTNVLQQIYQHIQRWGDDDYNLPPKVWAREAQRSIDLAQQLQQPLDDEQLKRRLIEHVEQHENMNSSIKVVIGNAKPHLDDFSFVDLLRKLNDLYLERACPLNPTHSSSPSIQALQAGTSRRFTDGQLHERSSEAQSGLTRQQRGGRGQGRLDRGGRGSGNPRDGSLSTL